MMNPWDRERAWREVEPGNQPRGVANGLMWLVAILLGVFGLVALIKSRGEGGVVALVPVGISLFFIFMFMLGHRREQRRLAVMRAAARHESGMALQEVRLEPAPLPKADDASLRKLYDRFDVRAIEQCRENALDARQITGFLEMARDFMDTAHAAQLIRQNNLAELDVHMHAALERAKLQYELNHPGAFKVHRSRPQEQPAPGTLKFFPDS
ncbi:MAG: hypothetical protein HS108_02910 [Planctomycetes bacterium]|jgi:hypothetical protein|nr:hypothetical protein [Planctomycetota bacterium]MCL4730111.1 hypothetical protein [Planctomycetota bacterium]